MQCLECDFFFFLAYLNVFIATAYHYNKFYCKSLYQLIISTLLIIIIHINISN